MCVKDVVRAQSEILTVAIEKPRPLHVCRKGLFGTPVGASHRGTFPRTFCANGAHVPSIFSSGFEHRKKIWKAEVLNSSDQKFWQATRNLVPHCPLFWRVDPSPDVIRADACIERELDVFEEHLFEHADHASVTQDEHGVRRVTATFVLKKEPSASRKRARWKILFRRGTDGA